MTSRNKIRDVPKQGSYCYTYGPNHEPVAKVNTNERIKLYAPDAFEDKIKSDKDRFSEVCVYPYLNPQVGPIFINGAEPGDTLAVSIHEIEPARDFAVTGLVPSFGGLTSTGATATLNEPLPEQVKIVPIRDRQLMFDKDISIPCQPFMGTMGVAPQIESINCLTPSYYGGNMDCPDVCPGNTILLPVSINGAHFMTGDGHAVQGDGEITGVACEVSMRIVVSFDVIKNKKVNWPRIVSDEYIMAVGSARPVDDAIRIAYKELLAWMTEDYGFEKWDAYHLLGQVGRVRLCNMCNPRYTVAAKLPRKYLR